jgi:hypothetical protein
VIIPVLVEGASFPDADLLPEELKDVASRMSQSLSGSSNRAYLEDLGHLIETVKSHLRKTLEHTRLSNTCRVTIYRASGYGEWALKGHDIPDLKFASGQSEVTFEVKPGRYSFYVCYRQVNFGSGYMGRSSVHEGESNRWEGMLQAGQYRLECGGGSSSGGLFFGPSRERLYLKQLSFTPWPELA